MGDVLNKNNVPVAVKFDDDYLSVTLVDKRVIAIPLDHVDWLRDATLDQRQNYKIGTYSIWWDDLDSGVDMEWLLLGDYETAT